MLLPAAGAERYSFTFFWYPGYDATLPEEVTSSRHSPRGGQRSGDQNADRPPEGGGDRGGDGDGGRVRVNTLLPEGSGVNALAGRPFGDLMLDKWNGVASNRLDGTAEGR